jgi:hypothetical protein
LPSSRPTSEQWAIRYNGVYVRPNRTSGRCHRATLPAPRLLKPELRNYLRAAPAGPSTGDLAEVALVEAKEAGRLTVELASRATTAVGTPGCEKAIDNKSRDA